MKSSFVVWTQRARNSAALRLSKCDSMIGSRKRVGTLTGIHSSGSVAAIPALPVGSASAGNSSNLLSNRSFSSYYEEKKKKKEKRRELFRAKQERKQRLQTRREGKPRGEKRNNFHKWFTQKKVDEEYMNRKARQANLDWQIQVAVILERSMVVLPDKEDWELEFEKLRAYLNQFDAPFPLEIGGIDPNDKELFKTHEELMEDLPEGFTPAPRETEADRTGDTRTVNRKLKTSIYLVVQKEGDRWHFPTVDLQEEETLLEAAKRALKEQVGEQLEFWSISNAPCAVDMKAFESPKDGLYGTKTFFLKLYYDEGEAATKNVSDFSWLDRQEMTEKVLQEQGENTSKFYHYLL